jgi:hypothetical protein
MSLTSAEEFDAGFSNQLWLHRAFDWACAYAPFQSLVWLGPNASLLDHQSDRTGVY